MKLSKLEVSNELLLIHCYYFLSKWGLQQKFYCSLFQTILGILGICGNIIAGFILSRKEMQNAFNLLLVTLACFDSTYVSSTYLLIIFNNTMSFRGIQKINAQKQSKIEIYNEGYGL